MREFDFDKIQQYELLEEIGRGGMGAVYHAVVDNCHVALKVCNAEEFDAQKRFRREVRAMQKIHHDNVMPVLDANLENDPPYYVMPLAEMSVYDLIPELSKDHRKALDVFIQICYGVRAAHLVGECHRDIKPQNALVLSDARIVVSDFGLAKFLDRDSTMLTKTEMCVGTELYMAPEQIIPGGSRDANTLTDIFQLGKTLYHIYTGQYPAVLSEEHIPANLWYIIQKATKLKPEDRFSDVSELIDAINDYIASLDPLANPYEAFSLGISIVNDQLAMGHYQKSNVDKLISILLREEVKDDVFLDLFDKIPERILALYGREYSDQLIPLFQKYSSTLDLIVKNKSFDYAETVAKKMQSIVISTSNINLKAISIECILIAAVDLNRFRAMNVFNKIIVSISNADEAFVISNMLSKNITRYSRIFSQVGREQLHRTIQRQWDNAKSARI